MTRMFDLKLHRDMTPSTTFPQSRDPIGSQLGFLILLFSLLDLSLDDHAHHRPELASVGLVAR